MEMGLLPNDLYLFFAFFSWGIPYALNQACSLLSIGPTRETGSSETSITGSRITQTDEAHFNCWKYFASVEQKQYPDLGTRFGGQDHLVQVNRALREPEFLGTEYQVRVDRTYTVSEEELNILIASAEEERPDILERLPTHSRVRLWSDILNGHVALEDVGVGISQVIPVLAACYASTQNHIQQPELHLHPKLQSQLADVFIERINLAVDQPVTQNVEIEPIAKAKPGEFHLSQFTIDAILECRAAVAEQQKDKGIYKTLTILETHSEHIILRILRRIRETGSAHIVNRRFAIRPEQVSVLFFDKQGDGSTLIKRLRISDDGDFIDRWPSGFFTEREADLFDE